MRSITYYDGSRLRKLPVLGALDAPQRRPRRARGLGYVSRPALTRARPEAVGAMVVESLATAPGIAGSRFGAFPEVSPMIVPARPGETTVVPTETVAVDHPTRDDLHMLRREYGMVPVEERSHGKVLLRAPGGGEDAVFVAAQAALAVHARGGRAAAHPNFLRIAQRLPLPSVAPAATQWALDNPGDPGLIGADVHALAAWTITRGDPAVRVAVLDEGVDTAHPLLRDAVVAEADFVDHNDTAAPDGDDAHGTACAGIVVSRDQDVSGLAPEASLVAARIAKSGANGVWVFDDFETADAIDWAWDEAGAAVLSNSWGGGPPAPIITRAVERAQAEGRGGLGAVVVAAAGNAQAEVEYPASIPAVVAVGASNQWDERKTRTSQDGELNWGSNSGEALDLMAPGVAIATTDISGGRGYTTSDTTDRFNGTSSATPFVAAAAALMLSARSDLTQARAVELLLQTAEPLGGQEEWNPRTGHGRLNAYAAIRAARRG